MSNYTSKRNKNIAKNFTMLFSNVDDPAIDEVLYSNIPFTPGAKPKNVNESIYYLHQYFMILSKEANSVVLSPEALRAIEVCETGITNLITQIQNDFTEYKKTHTKYNMDEYKKYEFLTDVITEYNTLKAQMIQNEGYSIERDKAILNEAQNAYYNDLNEDIDRYVERFNESYNVDNMAKDLIDDSVKAHLGSDTVTPESYLASKNKNAFNKDLNDKQNALNKQVNDAKTEYDNIIKDTKKSINEDLANLDQEYDKKINDSDKAFDEEIENIKVQKQDALVDYKAVNPTEFKNAYVMKKAEAASLGAEDISLQYVNMGLPMNDDSGDYFRWVDDTEDEKALTDRIDILDKEVQEFASKQNELNEKLMAQEELLLKDSNTLERLKKNFGKEFDLIDKYIYTVNTPEAEAPHKKTADELEEELRQRRAKKDARRQQILEVAQNRRSFNANLISTNEWVLGKFDPKKLNEYGYMDSRELVQTLKDAKANGETVQLPDEKTLEEELKKCDLPSLGEVVIEKEDPQIEIYERDKALRLTEEEKKALDNAVLIAVDKEPKVQKIKENLASLKIQEAELKSRIQDLEDVNFETISSRKFKEFAKEYDELGLSDVNGKNLEALYNDFTKAKNIKEDARTIINENKGGLIRGKDVDKLANAIKALNQFSNDLQTQLQFDKWDLAVNKAKEKNPNSPLKSFSEMTSSISNLSYFDTHPAKIDTDEAIDVATDTLRAYKDYLDVIKNIPDTGDKDLIAFQKKMQSLLKPIDEVSKNEKLVNAFYTFTDTVLEGSKPFTGIAMKLQEKRIPIQENITKIEKSLDLINSKYLDTVIATMKKAKDNVAVRDQLKNELNQVNKDYAYCGKARDVISAKIKVVQVANNAKEAKKKYDEIEAKESQLLVDKIEASKKIREEKAQKKTGIESKYGDIVKDAKNKLDNINKELNPKIKSLGIMISEFKALDFLEDNIKSKLKKVKNAQATILAKNIMARREHAKDKATALQSMDANLDLAMDGVVNSTKKYGWNSSYFTNVTDAIKEYRAQKENLGQDELTEEKFKAMTQKLYEHLNIYIEKRHEDKGSTKKGTEPGQIRLDAMRKLKRQLDIKMQKLKDLKVEENSIEIPNSAIFNVGTNLEKDVIERMFAEDPKTREDLKLIFKVDKSISEEAHRKRTAYRIDNKEKEPERQTLSPKDISNHFIEFIKENGDAIDRRFGDYVNDAIKNMKNNDRKALDTLVSTLLISKDKGFVSKDLASISKEINAYSNTVSVQKIGDALLNNKFNFKELNETLKDPNHLNKIQNDVKMQKAAMKLQQPNLNNPNASF